MWTYSGLGLAVSTGVLGVALLLAHCFAPDRSAFAKKLRAGFRALAGNAWACASLLVLLTIGVNVFLAWLRFPQAWIHDEQANLLTADTFASGRLTNPPHPHWEHFESFHILSQPTRTGKYPPGPALFMALGQKLIGAPIAGVWLSCALAVAAMYWMFRAWFPPVWAGVGGLLLALNAPLIQGWGQSYWGGSVALLGGALVFGGVRRICNQPHVRDAILCGTGMVLLALSRPMEGFLVCLPAVGILGTWFFRERQSSWQTRIFKIAIPMAAMGIGGFLAMGVYNRAVTGHALTMPYALHDQTYSASSLWIWKDPPPIPEYRHERMRDFYLTWGRQRQELLRSDVAAYGENLWRKPGYLIDFFPLGPALTLLAAGFFWRKPWYRMALLTCAGALLVHSQMATSLLFPHYLAPVAPLFFAVNVRCLRQIRVWNRPARTGSWLVRAAILSAMLLNVPMAVRWGLYERPHPHDFVRRELAVSGTGRHLVFVTYGKNYAGFDDWVVNAADIDAAPIVFARDVGTEKNQALAGYFRDRATWHWHLDSEMDMSLTPGLPAGPRPVPEPFLSVHESPNPFPSGENQP